MDEIKPVNVLQFGEGNFLRGFFDWGLNNLKRQNLFKGNVIVASPIDDNSVIRMLTVQEQKYNVVIEGLVKGEPVRSIDEVDVISQSFNAHQEWLRVLRTAHNPKVQVVVSNTTEAGIVFNVDDKFDDEVPNTFPAKLTIWMYERYRACLHGVIVIPCELIEANGEELHRCILNYAALWQLPENFSSWVTYRCVFYNTLVDRIVPGYPKAQAKELAKEIGWSDKLIVKAEPFSFFGLEIVNLTDNYIKLEHLESVIPMKKSGLNVLYTDKLETYRERKVHLLNGAHTALAICGLLSGLQTVEEAISADFPTFDLQDLLYSEVIPVLDLPESELLQFAMQVFDRFKNPYNQHLLSSIALNSVAKYTTRILPIVKRWVERKGELPENAVNILAGLITLYRQENLKFDKPETFEYFRNHSVPEILANSDFWGENLTELPGLVELVETNVI